MAPWILVTPASRGIGLELARRLLRTTDLPVVATARGSTDQAREAILQQRKDGNSPDVDGEGDSDRLTVLKLDVTDETTIADAAADCAARFPAKPADASASPSHLHLAFAVPGMLHAEKSPAQLDAAALHATFATNTIGPLLLLKHFAPMLPRKSAPALPLAHGGGGAVPAAHATWATMSARVGSITDNALGGWYSYRASKAAVNQITKSFDNFLRAQSGDRACALALHPGTVKTGLSKDYWGNVKQEKLFTPEFAAKCLVETVERVGIEGRGRCWDWKQEEIPP